MKMRYVYKYIGYSKKELYTTLDRALTGGNEDKYYRVLHQIDPYHMVRFEYTKETPIAYTCSMSAEGAARKLLEVLLPLAKQQELKELSSAFNEDNFISMVLNNTKEMPDIIWQDNYQEVDNEPSVEDILGN